MGLFDLFKKKKENSSEALEKAKKYNKQQKKTNEKLLDNELSEDTDGAKKSKRKKVYRNRRFWISMQKDLSGLGQNLD